MDYHTRKRLNIKTFMKKDDIEGTALAIRGTRSEGFLIASDNILNTEPATTNTYILTILYIKFLI
jgi:hypothetical protein